MVTLSANCTRAGVPDLLPIIPSGAQWAYDSVQCLRCPREL